MSTLHASILEATSEWFEDMVQELIDEGVSDDPTTIIEELNKRLARQPSEFPQRGVHEPVTLYVLDNPEDEAYKFVIDLACSTRKGDN